MNSELKTKLEKLALQKSKPFCYSCYKACPTGVCSTCHSDDLMRLTSSGCEYGLEWVIKELLNENLSSIDVDEAFEESVGSTLESETIHVGWMTLDAITVMKEQDPISWNIAKSEWENFEESEGNILSPDNGNTYFWTYEVEAFIESELVTEEES